MPKKATHLYSVRKNGFNVSPAGLRTDHYTVTKLAEDDLEVLATYNIQEMASGTLHCDCPAHKPWCRHCDMLRKFQAEEKIGSGWMYSFDRKEWIPPYTEQDLGVQS